MQKMSHKVLIN